MLVNIDMKKYITMARNLILGDEPKTDDKLIICSGDSFTYGDELAGDLLIPGYTDNLFEQNSNDDDRHQLSRKLVQLELEMRTSDPPRFVKYQEECRSRSWTGHLGKMIDHTVINCAGPGISNEEIVFRAFQIYNKSLEKYKPENILVCLMPTEIARWGFPQHDKKYGDEFEFQSFTVHHVHRPIEPEIVKPLFEYFLNELNDHDHIFRSIMNLKGAEAYFSNFGSEVIFFDSGIWYYSFSRVVDDRDLVKIIKSSIDVKLVLNRKDKVLAKQHYPESDHIVFANNVKQYLNKINF
jgi:hypothetical protein